MEDYMLQVVNIGTRQRPVFQSVMVESDGAIKWESNGSYLMDDVMEEIKWNGFYNFSEEATRKKRAAQYEEIAKREAKKRISGELLAEMEAEFGKGATVVNVLTGEEIVL